jgi:hypothetical protein
VGERELDVVVGKGSEVFGGRMRDWYEGRYVDRRRCMQAVAAIEYNKMR